MSYRGKKKVEKGVVSEKQREGGEFFLIKFPFPPLFVGTESVAVAVFGVGLYSALLCMVVVFAWKHHYSAWEKLADGRDRWTCCNDR